MDFSLIICTYNRAETLRELLAEVCRQEVEQSLNWEVIIADNNSTDNTKEIVREFSARFPARFNYHFEPKQGKSFALNSALTIARGEIIIFADDDIQPVSGWLQSFIDIFKDKNVAGVGGRILPKFDKEPDWLTTDMAFPYKFDFGSESIEITSPPFGANMAYRRKMFDNYGFFNVQLGPTVDNPGGLGEDSEFGKRIIESGEKVRYSSNALVYHPVTKEQSRKEFLYDWSFRYGQSIIKRNGINGKNKRLFGVPRYFIMQYLSSYFLSLFKFSKKERLYNRCLFHQTRGQIKAFKKLVANES